MALTHTGKVFVWGINGYGQLGVFPSRQCEQKNVPDMIPALRNIEFTKAICGPNHSLLLSSERIIYAFGENTVGQVGNDSFDHQYSPVRIGDDMRFKDIITNKENELSIAISIDDKVYIWGSVNNRRCIKPKEVTDCSGLSVFDIYAKYAKNKITYKTILFDKEFKPWEQINRSAKESNESQTKESKESPINGINDVKISRENTYTHKVLSSKKLDGILDIDNFLKNKSLVDQEMKKRIRFLYVFGIYGSKVIFATNDDMVYAFGHNRDGCLGLGTTEEHILKLMLNKSLSGKQLSDISSGYEHCIGLTATGECYGWGKNNYGQLGIGTIKDTSTPTLIEDLTDKVVVRVSCGSYHSMALTNDGDLFSWGHNTFAQLGDRTYNSRERPTQVLVNEPIATISSGINHSTALSRTGFVYVWGVNESGQLGRERERDIRKGREKAMSNRPKFIPGFENTLFKKAICGPNHTLLLSAEGIVYAFGDNTNGQIGNGLNTTQSTPFPVIIGNYKFKNIAACFRDDISMVVTTDDKVFVWGLVQNQKYPKPQLIREGLGKSLFDIYVKIAKNKVTFKAVNVNEDFDKDIIEVDTNSFRDWDHKNVASNDSSEECSQINGTDEEFDNHVFTETEDLMIGTLQSVTTVTSDTPNSVAKLTNPTHKETNTENVFLKHLRQSFNNPNSYDLIIRCDDSVIYCHKTILRIRNSKFYQVMSQRLTDDRTPAEVTINSNSFKSFYAFIQYLYAMDPEIDVQVIADLEKMSDFFDEPELKMLCSHKIQVLRNRIDLSNICPLYERAVSQELTGLEESCVEFAAKNWKTICRSDTFQAMDDTISKRLMLSVVKWQTN